MEDFEIELKRDFLEESEDLLSQAENAFLRLEEERNSADLLNEIFRVAHNLKGTSKAVGFDQMAQLTHVAENLILKLKEGQLEVSDPIVSGLLTFKDKVEEMIAGLQEDLDAVFDIDPVVQRLEELICGQAQEQSTPEVTVEDNEEERVSFKADPYEEEGEFFGAVPDGSAFEEEVPKTEAAISQNAPEQTAEVEISAAAIESMRELGLDVSELEAALAAKQAAPQAQEQSFSDKSDVEGLSFHNLESLSEARAAKEEVKAQNDAPKKEAVAKAAATSGEKDESIRVSLSRIDTINNIIGELVILQTVLGQRRYVNIQDDLSNKSIGMMGKLFKEVQEIAMSLRMLPLKGAFQKMNRIVRDTSKALNKDAKLIMIGEDTEVDKTVLERISDPLVHIIRNAVDHGLESPEERAASGKDPKGNIEIMAYHEGSNLAIQITDDGKGIDPEKIRQKAVQKGIIDERSSLSAEEIIQFIFHPGFSTKEQVTEVSGRGVGMDVVKTNIEALGGQVKVMSKMGEGSSFKIMIPLTLAIIEGLVVSSNDQKYVIPLSQIFELTRVETKSIERFTGAADLFTLRGEVIPLFNLNQKLGAKPVERDNQIVIIIRGLGKPFGVSIDDALNQQQIVIKKLGEDLKGKDGVMGSAIMSDGRPSLILDIFELFRGDLKESKAHKRYKEQSHAA